MSESIVGKRVIQVRSMTKRELQNEGWDASPYDITTAIVFDDGTVLYASQDPEGNGPGALFGYSKVGRICVMPPSKVTS